jgi:hypothetical protein
MGKGDESVLNEEKQGQLVPRGRHKDQLSCGIGK